MSIYVEVTHEFWHFPPDIGVKSTLHDPAISDHLTQLIHNFSCLAGVKTLLKKQKFKFKIKCKCEKVDFSPPSYINNKS